MTFAVAEVGLLAMMTFDQVVAAFATVEALEDGDPHGLHARLLFRLRRGVAISGRVGGARLVTGRGSVCRASGLDLLLLFLFCFVPRDDEGSGLGAAAEGAAQDGDGGALPDPPPPAPPGVADVDATAAADEEDEGDGEDEEDVPPRSRLHSSLWPARHAARWQAWLQYFRCRHPEHFCSGWSVAGAPQNAHCSVMFKRVCVGWKRTTLKSSSAEEFVGFSWSGSHCLPWQIRNAKLSVLSRTVLQTPVSRLRAADVSTACDTMLLPHSHKQWCGGDVNRITHTRAEFFYMRALSGSGTVCRTWVITCLKKKSSKYFSWTAFHVAQHYIL